MPTLWQIVTTTAAVVGPTIAFYQRQERKKLENYNKSQAWYLYSKTNNMTGIAQRSLDVYKKVHAENMNLELLELLSKTSAHGLDLFRETARAIQLSEPDFTEDAIERWVKMGKIDGADHRSLFTPLLSEKPENISLISRVKKLCRRSA